MKWTLISKTANPTVEAYGWHDQRVKEFLRDEGGRRCVYCAVNENALGGIQAFHIEHYKPKTKFPKLENSLANLFYSCPICNRFKLNDWPAEPHRKLHTSCYPNPSVVDYSTIFLVDWNTGLVSGNVIASKYVVERLYFNRPQLIMERRKFLLDQDLEAILAENNALMAQLAKRTSAESRKYLTRLGTLSGNLNLLFLKLNKIPSYEVSDVTKPKGKRKSKKSA